MHRKLFFSTSGAVADRLTETFDFVWGTATAQWNLRWQVDGFIRANPTATDDDLKSRFALGSGIRGANLRRSCLSTTWEAQQEMFARILVVEFCALFEAWIEGTLEATGQDPRHSKSLQFPSMNGQGVTAALAALLTNRSPELEHSVYPVLLTNRKNAIAKLENLLRCYRYFKECRNAVVHRGGVSSQRSVDASASFAAETTQTLGVTEVPKHFPIAAVGDPVRLSLRGVVGFGEIVLKLVTTLDAELSRTIEAEAVLAERWIETHGARHHLPAGVRAQETRIEKLFRGLGLESPTDPIALLPMLRRRNLLAAI
ncbi:MAG: hypothetical protein ACOZJX_22095 [Pseudomonadota bacterium]